MNKDHSRTQKYHKYVLIHWSQGSVILHVFQIYFIYRLFGSVHLDINKYCVVLLHAQDLCMEFRNSEFPPLDGTRQFLMIYCDVANTSEK